MSSGMVGLVTMSLQQCMLVREKSVIGCSNTEKIQKCKNTGIIRCLRPGQRSIEGQETVWKGISPTD